MISANTKQLEQLQKKLGSMQLQFAQRNTINGMAFQTQRNARETMRKQFTLRNKWSVGSVRVDTAKSLRDSAVTGSTERYMADVEFGHTDTQHTAMATTAASGEAPRAKVRRKPVRRANRMSAINLGPRVSGMSRKQRNIVALKEAKESGRKFVFLDRGPRDKGIYRVMGTKKRPKSRKIQDLSRKVAVVPKNPWLLPSTVSPQQTRAIFFQEMRRQVRRLR